MIRKQSTRPSLSIGLAALFVLAAILMCGCPEKDPDPDPASSDITGPQSVNRFAALAYSSRVELSWKIPTAQDSSLNKDVQGVLIVRAEDQSPLAAPYRGERFEVGDTLGRGQVIYVGGEQLFTDDTVEMGTTYYYEAFAFDDAPNYSESSLLSATPGSLIHPRIAHSQTLLDDGRVLLVGGIGHEGPLKDAEIFDPETGTFSEVVSEMQKTRFDHTATLLADGRVLIIGGYEEGLLDTLNSAEIFDPATDEFVWSSAKMSVGRATHTVSPLADGTYLVVGGTDGFNAYASAEIFDPEAFEFVSIEATLLRKRTSHTATSVLIDGYDRVMIAGGFDGFTTVAYGSFYDPLDMLFADFTGNAEAETAMVWGRLAHTATLFADGRVLFAGGFEGTLEAGGAIAECELFDPLDASVFEATGSLAQARSGHTAALLGDGTTLIIGGIDASLNILDSTEIYDPATGEFTQGFPLNFKRTVPATTVLLDGRVLVSGGNGSTYLFEPDPVSTAEIYDPATGTFSVVGQSGS